MIDTILRGIQWMAARKGVGWTMEKTLALVTKKIPGVISVWFYPWIMRDLLLPYVGGLPDPLFLCEKLVAAFTNPPATIDPTTQVPEEAFALTVVEAVTALTGMTLSHVDLAPLLVKLGERGLADPQLKGGAA